MTAPSAAAPTDSVYPFAATVGGEGMKRALAAGTWTGHGRVIAAEHKRAPGASAPVVLLTDGQANVSRGAGPGAEADALTLARNPVQSGVLGLVTDTETSPVQLGLPGRLAHAWDTTRQSLNNLGGRPLPGTVHREQLAG